MYIKGLSLVVSNDGDGEQKLFLHIDEDLVLTREETVALRDKLNRKLEDWDYKP